ncbi:low-density lipoprotein receptor-related protein 2-like [Diadema setosum]|uniref:low-density lipoprotein receptor-related protein 2-like n=1 Tax=Diadema setosum TaxID=31175 RepID=UPI003B3A123F
MEKDSRAHAQDVCTQDQFTCPSGDCVSLDSRCDGVPDCPTTPDDEFNCPDAMLTNCRVDYVRCPRSGNNICISPSMRCDGNDDCFDNSDEDSDYCQRTDCPDSFIKCVVDGNTRCLSGESLCDGLQNCDDNSDEPAYCTGTDPWPCPEFHFQCNTSRRCISDLKVCDGTDDCEDGSDEPDNCSGHMCREGYYTCLVKRFDGARCIPNTEKCDGMAQCEYADDEEDSCGKPARIPACGANEFTCDNGLCILAAYRCDHYNDCGDASDEPGSCDYRDCDASTEFQCGNGACVLDAFRCDGSEDCHDGSDERYCPECESDQFLCDDVRCIPSSNVCDNAIHCEDGSDERYCGINECLGNPCSESCMDLPTGFECQCTTPGFQLGPDSRTCVDIDECAETPEVCSQTCTNTQGSYACACITDYTLSTGGSCIRSTNEDPFLLISNRYYVRQFDTLQADNVNSIVAQDFDFAVAIDFDSRENRIYLSDVIADSIIRVDRDGRNKEPIIERDAGSVEGLAVDWVARKLYWSDRPRRVLEVAELDGSSRRVLKRNNLFEVRGVAVDPKHGNMYWTDWGLRAYIGRMGMDGTNAMEIHDSNIAWPNGISVDYSADRIYWTDAHLDHIIFADLDGSNIRELANDDSYHRIAHPFSISVFEDSVYWTEWNVKKVYRANKLTGQDEIELVETVHRPMDITVYHSLRQDSSLINPCGTDNGGCSHLCVIAAGGGASACLCPDNYEMQADGRTCTESCIGRQFHCPIDGKCIEWYEQCNGFDDCLYGEDERNCPTRFCPSNLFQCNIGTPQCIPVFWLCDGDLDCADGSDEQTCVEECQDFEFRCDSGRCISRTRVCDLTRDCPDGEDEDDEMCGARTTSCAEGYFTCDNGFCIPEAWVCDVDNDCGDMSDEPHNQCYQGTCPAGWFSCEDSYRCIPLYMRCNGYYDCRRNDRSDEEGCPEVTCDPIGDFRCANHRCIPKRWECDFNNDCGDWSDEYQGCVYRNCSESEFRCSNQRCIQGKLLCNGEFNCADGLDEAADICSESHCEPGFQKCAFGACINSTLFCNGRQNCYDGSDERDCDAVEPSCSASEFMCRNSRCIFNEYVCDGSDDCGDDTDESTEACRASTCEGSDRFLCPISGLCIWRAQLCDGFNNCGSGDSSDEQGCTSIPCGTDSFRCNNGTCISFNDVCNDVIDCPDGYDELGCNKDSSCAVDNGGCEQICMSVSDTTTILCQCRAGYALSRDGRSCVDVNECLDFVCIQSCTNIKGSYQCSCAEGYNGLNNTCDAQGAQEYLIVADGQTIFTNRDGERNKVVDHQTRVSGLDYMLETRYVYFVDSEARSIKRHSLDLDSSFAPENLAVDNVFRPIDIAVDWIGRNIYFTDQGSPTLVTTRRRRRRQVASDPYPKIAVANLEGQFEMTLTKQNVESPTALVVNPRRGYVYWADSGSTVGSAFIGRAYMNGENSIQIVRRGLVQPTGMTIDFANDDRIFFVDQKLNILQGMAFDGSNRKTLMSGALYNPFQVEVFEDTFYWTASSTGEVLAAKRLNTAKNVTEIPNLVNPGAIRMYQFQRYPQHLDNPCISRICSGLCLLSPNDDDGVTSNCDDCHCENGGVCLSDGSYASNVPILAGVSSTLIVIILILMLLLLLYAYKRRAKSKRETAGNVSYNNGTTNVELDRNRFPPTNQSNPVYETAYPATFENPGFVPPMGAVGGGQPSYPAEKTGLPDEVAGPLPDKEFSDAEKLAMYTSTIYPDAPPPHAFMPPPPHSHMPEPPPAYSAEAQQGQRVDDMHIEVGAPPAGGDERGLVDNEGQE